MISNKAYDVLKWIVIIFMPALNTLIFALGNVLQFDATVTCGIISAVTVFLGALIGVSTKNFNKKNVTKKEGET